ncbi:MAG: 4-hydroxybenzoyl-CoA reductase subunit beta [Deltaproteobacteria bacterium]|nr:MAG: 4-hydroxybenzoyl-CoA reductase subunit beta [Deltaproteobacteria bacterium]
MLPLPSFALEQPDRLDDVLGMAGQLGVKLVAGGTDLLPSMKHRLFRPSTLVSLSRVRDLAGIRQTEDGGLRIGATTTLREVRRNAAVRTRYPALAQACATVATSTIQAMGTLGGNVMLDTRCIYYNQPAGWRRSIGGCLKSEGKICHVAPKGKGCYATQSSDTVPCLILYGAELELASAHGTRTVAMADLWGDDGRDWLAVDEDEVLTAIVLPPPGAHVVHRKVRARGAIDYGLLLVAVQRHGPGGRAVIGALGPAPVQVESETLEDLPQVAWKASMPLSTHAWSSTWRKHMVRVEVKRAITELDRPHLAGA